MVNTTGQTRTNTKNQDPGEKIELIILTGHSLGGMMAQVAHVILKAKGSSKIGELQDLINGNDVTIRTVAFAAPMSIALTEGKQQQDSEGAQFLYGTIAPDMVNIVFKDDIFPRAYSHLLFIIGMYNMVTTSLLKDKKDKLNNFLKRLIDMLRTDNIQETVKGYRHFGKIIYYENVEAIPTIHRDLGYSETGWPKLDSGETSFRIVERTASSDVDLMSYHMALINPGLAFSV